MGKQSSPKSLAAAEMPPWLWSYQHLQNPLNSLVHAKEELCLWNKLPWVCSSDPVCSSGLHTLWSEPTMFTFQGQNGSSNHLFDPKRGSKHRHELSEGPGKAQVSEEPLTKFLMWSSAWKWLTANTISWHTTCFILKHFVCRAGEFLSNSAISALGLFTPFFPPFHEVITSLDR